jgi:regulatory protein
MPLPRQLISFLSMSNDAYLDGLKLLARRELSEAQVRRRLERRGFDKDTVDRAIERLKAARGIDDHRVATAIVRTEALVKRRGTLRVKQRLERAGIAPAVARKVMNEILQEVDDASLIETALLKKLRGRITISSERELQRLYRFLVRQGFEPERILQALNARRAFSTDPRADE